jgi:hypothetical protein
VLAYQTGLFEAATGGQAITMSARLAERLAHPLSKPATTSRR